MNIVMNVLYILCANSVSFLITAMLVILFSIIFL
jgi:hypothetical protein